MAKTSTTLGKGGSRATEHKATASSKKSLQSVTKSSAGTQITYKDGTGYWKENKKK